MQVSWSQLKSFVDQRGLSVQWIEFDKRYELVAIDGPFTLEHSMDKSPSDETDLDDFEDNYKDDGNLHPTSDVVMRLNPKSVTIDPMGFMFTATKDDVTSHTVKLETARRLRGGIMKVKDAEYGDWVKVEITDEDGVVAPAGTVLATYISKWCVLPGEINEMVDVDLSDEINGAFYIKVTYTSAGTSTDPTVLFNVLAYKDA